MCVHFTKGSCKYGDRCRFSHIRSAGSARPAAPPRQQNDARTSAQQQGGSLQRTDSIKLIGLPPNATQVDLLRLCADTPFAGALNGLPVVRQSKGDPVAYINLSDGSVAARLAAALDGKRLRGNLLRAAVQSLGMADHPPAQGNAPSTRTAASADVTKFWSRMKTAVDGGLKKIDGLKLHEPHNLKQWFACWSAASAGAQGHLEVLLIVMMMAPAKSALAPPAHDVLHVLSRVVSQPHAGDGDLSILELVHDVLCKRLLGNIAHVVQPEAALGHVDAISTGFVHKLQKTMRPDNLLRSGPLMACFAETVASYKDSLQRVIRSRVVSDAEGSAAEAQPWKGWVSEPTVGWLMGPDWLRPPELSSQYPDVASYCETLQRLTTLLTFYWGAGAISPRCRHQQPGNAASDAKCCGEPLLTACAAGRACTARLPGGGVCNALAVLGCPRGNHPEHLCVPCLRRGQLSLLGNPRQQKAPCSTDVYDAVVEREQVRREGHVYVLSQLCSRRPPAIEPNWRTSYRLNCASLVAVGRLSSSCEALQRTTRIYWAEVVPVSTAQDADEAKARKLGHIAVRLLGRSDVSAFPPASDFELGTRVFIIDLRVFVPEVISVLATYADPTLAEQLGRIGFVNRLIGQGTPPTPNTDSLQSATQRVSASLFRSEIEVVQRMSESTRNTLIQQIGQLATQGNLYGTQLDAFCQGLEYTVHCTQGPPGTGKSYTGVQLIAALDLIRRAAIGEGRAVGPIIVLAYKNHALDEILLDLLAHPLLQLKSAGNLIRCGNPDDLKLNLYRESTSFAERMWKDALDKRLIALRTARSLGNDVYDLSAHLHANAPGAQKLSFGEVRHILTSWRSGKAAGVGCIELTRRLFMLLSELNEARAQHGAKDGEETELGEGAAKRRWRLVRSSLEAYQQLGAACAAADDSDVRSEAVLACIRELADGAVHWANPLERIPGEKATSRAAALLHAWLSGLIPPPRCMAAEEDTAGDHDGRGKPSFLCLNAACQPSPYCFNLHKCLHGSGCRQRRSSIPVVTVYCELHRCQAQGGQLCAAASVAGSDFCMDHSCRACVYMHQQTGAPIEQAFGQACKPHTCTLLNCSNMMFGPGVAFCQQHSCGECLRANPNSVLPALPRSSLCKEHKCMAAGCNLLRDAGADVPQQYCRDHSCYMCVAVRQVVDPQLPESRLCADHRCRFKLAAAGAGALCWHPRFGASQWCEGHSCRVCIHLVSEGCIAPQQICPADAENRRNVCSLHRLCSAVLRNGAMCDNLAEHNEHYCEEHGRLTAQQQRAQQQSSLTHVKQTCRGTTTKGKPCKTKGDAPHNVKFYCDAHADQASSSEEDADSDEQDWVMPDGEDAEPTAPLAAAKSTGWSAAGFLSLASTTVQSAAQVFASPPPDVGGAAEASVLAPILVNQPAEPEAAGPPPAVAPSAPLVATCSRVLEAEQLLTQVIPGAFVPELWDRELWRSRAERVGAPSELAELLKAFEASLNPWVLGESWAASARDDWARSLDQICRGEGSSSSPMNPEGVLESLLAALIVRLERALIGESEAPPPALPPVDGHSLEPADDLPADPVDESVAFDLLDPDELEYDEGEDEQAEENEEQQRLQEVLGEKAVSEAGSNDESDDDADTAHGRASREVTAALFDRLVASIQRWSWSMTIEERWKALASCLEQMGDVVTMLRTLAEPQLDEARLNRAEAAAASFKMARIIGATVVGAARRLEALRAAEPFAVVVEEACEVMEPTLMAVLSVPSLCKLELVGDHRQLPAFVQQCWFNLETTIPSLKVSLFERLITSGQEGEGVVACAVLDEQRRMRPAIAELTSGHYSDLVEIKGHAVTRTQRIGDKAMAKLAAGRSSALKVERELWHAKGMLVPGMVAQQFFWDLPENRQGKPVAGLSACNYVEAEAVANVVKYLTVACGVPPPSISVITPYKGQKMAIIKALRTIAPGAVPRPTFKQQVKGGGKGGGTGPVVDSKSAVIVSTVDRYQGDENDIVLLSLVRTKPGNRFVALKNRFIVAASRARMGFYIFGSSDAIAKSASGRRGPEHWVGLLNQLGGADGSATGGNAGSAFVAECEPCETSSGVGRSFPICCPRHPEARLLVQCGCTDPKCKKVHFPRSGADKWDAFCTQRCSQKLEWCGHFCSVPCHSPVAQPHTIAERCPEIMGRPCEDHPQAPLQCGALFQNSKARNVSFDQALIPAGFHCEVEVEYRRPDCPHRVTLSCWQHRQLLAGEFKLPPCDETVEDWHHPACNHVSKSPRCSWRREAEANPPLCMTAIKLVRPCGCEAEMRCHERAAEQSTAATCLMSVSMERPRCTHMLSLKCFERTALRNLWLNEGGERAQRRVPERPTSVEVRCDETYGQSETELSRRLPDGMTTVPKCSVPVKYVLPCGHRIKDVPCATAFRWADPADSTAPPSCKELVTLHSKLCGHEVQAECWVTTSDEWNAFPHLCDPAVDNGAVPEGRLESMPNLSSAIARVVKAWCPQQIRVRRHCQHTTELACTRILSKRPLPQCKELVSRRLDLCGHDVPVACHKKAEDPPECHAVVETPFTFSCGRHMRLPGTCCKLRNLKELNPPCDELVTASRFRCGHTVSLPCRLQGLATCDVSHTGKRLVDEVIKAGEEYCTAADELPACDTLLLFRGECGHDRPNIPCDLAFQWAAAPEAVPPCETLVDTISPLCGHALRVRCHEAERIAQFDLWGDLRDGEEPWRESATVGFDQNGEPIERLQVSHDASRPNVGQLSPSDLQLLGSSGCVSLVLRDCGHTEQVSCINVLRALDSGRCSSLVSVACPECMHEMFVPCHREQSIRAGEVRHKCEERIVKLCTTCHVTELLVPCCQLDVHCGAEVTAPLPCGHEMSWTCGEEADPRDRSHLCAECLLPTWRLLLSEPPPVLEFKQLQMHAVADLDERYFQLERDLAGTDLVKGWRERLIEAQRKIVSTNCDLLRGKIDNSELWERSADPPRLSETLSFDAVFWYLEQDAKPDEATIPKAFEPRITPYGTGTALLPLTMDNLKNRKPSDDLTLRVCVGVAFRFAALTDAAPFTKGEAGKQRARAPRNEEERRRAQAKEEKKKRAQADGLKKANRLARQAMQKGFDYVLPCTDKDEYDALRIYWQPGAVVPLCILKLQIHRSCGACGESRFGPTDGSPAEGHEFLCWGCRRDCIICFESYAVGEGFECSSDDAPHFMCRGCLRGHVAHASHADSIETFRQRGGVTCPMQGCEAPPFTEQALAEHLSKEDFDAFLHAKEMVLEAKVLAQIKAENERRQAAEAMQGLRLRHKAHVVDKILTLACPRCGQAFVDFDGCLALTCRRVSCGCAFCGLCQLDCGKDAHAHVRQCPDNPALGYFCDEATFRRVQNERRKRKLLAYFDTLAGEHRRETLEDCTPELRDLGLDPAEFRARP